MIIESKYCTTPIYGIISKDAKKFNDCDLFKGELWKYAVLKKIKIWWGTPKKEENIPSIKTLIGIQCKYKNIMTGEEIESEVHCGKIESNDIAVQEISLKENDYFNQFHIGFDNFISYIKIMTKNEEVIEFGKPIKEEIKKVKLNMEKEPNMVQCFVGYYNENRVTALGCKYIKKKDFIFLNLMDILRLRHFFKNNENEKAKWENNNLLDQHKLFIKAVAKLCLLPDGLFNIILTYLA